MYYQPPCHKNVCTLSNHTDTSHSLSTSPKLIQYHPQGGPVDTDIYDHT